MVKRYRLPSVSALFEIDQLVYKPKAFFHLARDIFPGTCAPTVYHYFVKLLAIENLLQRHYTQNIDMTERLIGIPPELLVEASGTFFTSHCIDCHLEHSLNWLREQLLIENDIPRCTRCRSLVRPDLVFVGEKLPPRFYLLPEADLGNCDLLIVMGAQLEAMPFAGLLDRVGDKCVRLMILDDVAERSSQVASWQQGEVNEGRDVQWTIESEEDIWDLVEKLDLLVIGYLLFLQFCF